MRDPNDSSTQDLVPAKRGRPVLDVDAGPMTPAERARRYRELRRLRAGRIGLQATRYLDPKREDYLDTTCQLTDAVLLDAIRDRIADLGASPSAAKKARVAALVAELARRHG